MPTHNELRNALLTIAATALEAAKKLDEKPKKPCCYRCGRYTHFVANCFAQTHLKGYLLED
jgi:hypothetical protein